MFRNTQATFFNLFHDHPTILSEYALGKRQKCRFIEIDTWVVKMSVKKGFLKFNVWPILCSLNIFYSVESMCNDNSFCSETLRLRFAICFVTTRPLFSNISQDIHHFMNFCLLKTHLFMQNETIFQKSRICKFSKFNAIYKKIYASD